MTAILSDREPATPARVAAPRRRRRRTDLGVRVLIAVVALLVVVGAVVPLVAVLATAFAPDALPRYAEFFTSRVDLVVLRNTLVLGALVGLCGTALGFLFAFVQTRLDVPGKKILHVIALMPIVSPPFAIATATVVLYGRRGVVSNGVFGVEYDIYGLDGLVFVLSLSLFPVAYLGLLGMLRGLDPALEEAAMNMGASRWRILRTLILPLVAPGLVAPFLLLFVEAIADLANPLVLGGDYTVLASRAYLAVTGEYDITGAAVYCVILLVPSLAMYFGQRHWMSRKVRTTITGRPSGSVHLITGWTRWPFYSLALLAAAVILSLYGTVLVGSVTRVFGVDNTFTLDYLKEVVAGVGVEAVLDTLRFAAIATPVAGLVGLVIAWLVVRHLDRTAWLLDLGGTLGVAVPGTVLGIGFVLAYRPDRWIGPVHALPSLVGGSAIAGGAVAIVLAYVVRSIPAGQRTAVGSLTQLHPYIEQASTDLGASPLQTFRRVTLPLIRPALLTGLSYSFARSMTSVSTIVLLVTPQTKIITSQVLSAAGTGRYGVAFAYCTVLTVLVLAGFALIRLLVGTGAALHRTATSERQKS
ncbi:iron ABC transporter permease [Streptomyces caniscabiei]|uniref:Iron ABC transporter permease n=1 Tax=Streptomyces caniscabiei TaxID=2746961 RepID=A0A927QIG7_9ACTN|nr:iron ABC transporter permease [Streptomyces caniscabiei]MBD9721859.1 iron ABC transporter permease [Streptomyces caniscabiei]MDX3509051.1 iron ABC transporter permease [Streptomyces caniscabiei]MDX3717196.1 iron ABC transporter permease [Streptomyces caniscabiei]MDX3728193.1 iron ABC transporter permease [Streptomyces caniscabiei]WEO23060.1 iron ABC transporter permease [Streptomyces caniscabiei]